MNYQRQMIAIGAIKCIREDVQQWEALHGERPGRIFATTELYSVLVEYSQEFKFIDRVEIVGECLFGVPLSQYCPTNKRRVAYHLGEKERLVALGKEDF